MTQNTKQEMTEHTVPCILKIEDTSCGYRDCEDTPRGDWSVQGSKLFLATHLIPVEVLDAYNRNLEEFRRIQELLEHLSLTAKVPPPPPLPPRPMPESWRRFQFPKSIALKSPGSS